MAPGTLVDAQGCPIDLPSYGPFPKPSDEYVLTNEDFPTRSLRTIGEVTAQIGIALRGAGYTKSRFFQVLGGIAIGTRFERVHKDGSPYPESRRWIGKLEDETLSFSIAEYLRVLFNQSPGNYRVLVFVISSRRLSITEDEPERPRLIASLEKGATWLPQDAEEIPFTPDHHITVLVYEFKQAARWQPAVPWNSGVTANKHLQKTRLLASEWR